MTEEEFWQSTAARVHELGMARDGYDRRRDFFVAYLAASHAKDMVPDDILAAYYPHKSVTVTHDPEDGALLR